MKNYTCDQCNKEFKRQESSVKGKKVFCCRKCKYDYQKENLKGENNPNYRKGDWVSESFCSCGNLKDSRSSQCSICSKKSFLVGGETKPGQDDLNIISTVRSSLTIVEAAKRIGISRYLLKQKIDSLSIDTSHMKRCSKRPYKFEEIFCLRPSGERNYNIRSRFKELSGKEYVCSICSQNPEWNGEVLTLQLHHKNGMSNDDRLENLEWLCPNCHSQTSSYVGRNVKRNRKEGGLG